MSWANKIVKEAWLCSTPFTTKDPDNIIEKFKNKIVDWLADNSYQHYGIQVLTNKGNYWLIHNAYSPDREEYGIYVTDTRLSNKWTRRKINVVRDNVNLSKCEIVMGWREGHSKEDWLKSGTCLGAAFLLGKYLTDPNFNYEYYTESDTILKLIKDFLLQ